MKNVETLVFVVVVWYQNKILIFGWQNFYRAHRNMNIFLEFVCGIKSKVATKSSLMSWNPIMALLKKKRKYTRLTRKVAARRCRMFYEFLIYWTFAVICMYCLTNIIPNIASNFHSSTLKALFLSKKKIDARKIENIAPSVRKIIHSGL